MSIEYFQDEVFGNVWRVKNGKLECNVIGSNIVKPGWFHINDGESLERQMNFYQLKSITKEEAFQLCL